MNYSNIQITQISNEILIKLKPNNFYKKALLQGYGYRCFFCNELIVRWDNFQVDHLIPQNSFEEMKKISYIKKKFGFPKNLDMQLFQNSYFNLVPMHSGCNLFKSDRILNKNVYYLQFDKIKNKISIIFKIQKEIEESSNNLSILSELDGYINSKKIQISDLIYYFELNHDKSFEYLIKFAFVPNHRIEFNDFLLKFLNSHYSIFIKNIKSICLDELIKKWDIKNNERLILDKYLNYLGNTEKNLIKCNENELDELKITLDIIHKRNSNPLFYGHYTPIFIFGYQNLADKEININDKLRLLNKIVEICKIQLFAIRESTEVFLEILALTTFSLRTILSQILLLRDITLIEKIFQDSKEIYEFFDKINDLLIMNWLDIGINYYFILKVKYIKNPDHNTNILIKEIEKRFFNYCDTAQEFIPLLSFCFDLILDQFVEYDEIAIIKKDIDEFFSRYKTEFDINSIKNWLKLKNDSLNIDGI